MKTQSQVIVRPARNVRGSVQLPGDKSISHRYAMLAGIAEGPSRLENYSTGADCASTLGCMRALGVTWERKDGNVIEVQGRGLSLTAPDRAARLRQLRFDDAHAERHRCWADIHQRDDWRRVALPPSHGSASSSRSPRWERRSHRKTESRRCASQERALKAIDYKMPVASAQVKSCLLFAGLFADGETRIEEPFRTRDHGEVALRAFGAQSDRRAVRAETNEVSIRGGQRLRGIEARDPRRPVERSILPLRGGAVSRIAADPSESADESDARPPARYSYADGTAHLRNAARRDSRRNGGIAANGRRQTEGHNHRGRRLSLAHR